MKQKRSTLLKVMSIIVIVLGAFSLLSLIASLAMKDMLATTYESMGMTMPSATSLLVTMLPAIIIYLAAGIIGLMYKSKKSVMIMGVILAVYYVISLIYSIISTGFTFMSLIELIIPLLYLWGWYQSN